MKLEHRVGFEDTSMGAQLGKCILRLYGDCLRKSTRKEVLRGQQVRTLFLGEDVFLQHRSLPLYVSFIMIATDRWRARRLLNDGVQDLHIVLHPLSQTIYLLE
jgi:hypothetical protein